MALAATPSNFAAQTGNQQNFLTWDFTAGATSYSIERSTDGLTFTVLATTAANNYIDLAVTLGTQYFYKVASVNATGTSSYTSSQSVVPTISGEMSLGAIRLAAQQRADRVNSQFIKTPEWNQMINQSLYELYDLLITAYEDYFVTSPAKFSTDGTTYLYPLPDGVTTFTDINGNSYIPDPFYKLAGVDLGINSGPNGWVNVNKFNFIDRNRFVAPNMNMFNGVFNLQYHIVGSKIQLIPTPSAGQSVRLWFYPRLTMLLKDNDTTTSSISGWIEYVIVDAAIKALQKEESDVSVLMLQKAALKQRIEESSVNRDVGQADKISDVRGAGWGYGGPNSSGFMGGGY